MRAPPRKLLSLLTLVVSAYYALWACAPAASMQPIGRLEIGASEFGAGGGLTEPIGTSGACDYLLGCRSGGFGQAWYSHRISRLVSMSGTLFGGQTTLFGGGAQLRLHLVDNVWLYTAPSVGMRAFQQVRLPLGLSVGIGEHFALTAEGSWGFGGSGTFAGVSETDLWSAGLGASYRY